jgi:site-specific DNA recombinase
MKSALIYARVSSKDQEREGYSIPAQLKFLRDYAQKNDFQIAREFVDVETAKMAGRKKFGEMVRYLEKMPHCRVVIVEKTDRLYRNLRDCLTLEDLDIEIHLPKEGQIISKAARSQAKLIHGIHVAMARNYIENLREEVKKGMREKAEQGIYPSRPPIGYRNNKVEHTIEVDLGKAPIARRIFELYATRKYSLSQLRLAIRSEFGVKMAKSYLDRLLKNPFYAGSFIWEGKTYPGTHTPLVDRFLFEQVQSAFHGRNKPRYQKHDFAFRGLLKCAYDECMVTAEIKKQKYTYYRCTDSRGKCELPYFREEELGNRLGEILKDIYIPDHVLSKLVESLMSEKVCETTLQQNQEQRLQQRLASVRNRLDQAYLDKLDGKIPEELWIRKSAEWQAEVQQIQMATRAVGEIKPERMLDAAKILELANKAYFLYVKQSPAEKAKLLSMALSNCSIDATSIYPTYRKPFEVIFAKGKMRGGGARRDSNPRPSA